MIVFDRDVDLGAPEAGWIRQQLVFCILGLEMLGKIISLNVGHLYLDAKGMLTSHEHLGSDSQFIA